LKRTTDNAKKEYLENICREIMEYQRTGLYDLMYIKTRELGWKQIQGIQNNGIENSQRSSSSKSSADNLGKLYFRTVRLT
jgi:hypothetical protein